MEPEIWEWIRIFSGIIFLMCAPLTAGWSFWYKKELISGLIVLAGIVLSMAVADVLSWYWTPVANLNNNSSTNPLWFNNLYGSLIWMSLFLFWSQACYQARLFGKGLDILFSLLQLGLVYSLLGKWLLVAGVFEYWQLPVQFIPICWILLAGFSLLAIEWLQGRELSFEETPTFAPFFGMLPAIVLCVEDYHQLILAIVWALQSWGVIYFIKKSIHSSKENPIRAEWFFWVKLALLGFAHSSLLYLILVVLILDLLFLGATYALRAPLRTQKLSGLSLGLSLSGLLGLVGIISVIERQAWDWNKLTKPAIAAFICMAGAFMITYLLVVAFSLGQKMWRRGQKPI